VRDGHGASSVATPTLLENGLYVLHLSALDANGAASSTTARDAAGRITRIVDPMGYERRYEHDASGVLVRFEDSAGSRTSFACDAQHELQEVVDAAERTGQAPPRRS